MNKCLWALPVLFLAFSANAQTYVPEPKDDAATLLKIEKQYSDKNFPVEKLLPSIREIAEKGNPQAQYLMGYLYGNGLGISKDYSEALTWYHKAVAQNYAPAMFKIGVYYERGWGLSRNMDEATKWYAKSAAAGYAMAQEELGKVYMYGKGVPYQPTRQCACSSLQLIRTAQAQ